MYMAGCSADSDTMQLLDVPAERIKLSAFENYGGINEDYIYSFGKEEDLEVFVKAIETAVKQPAADFVSDPDYDMLVEYSSAEGDVPAHGIHLWTGDRVKFMYIADENVYAADLEMSRKLNELIK